MDRSDACEQAAKDAKVRAAKAEEEVADLVKKAQQLEVELDKTTEELLTTTEKLKEKENALLSAELEVNALNRRVQGLEEDLEKCEDKLLQATNKLDKAATAADDSDRMRKVLENRAVQDEERMSKLRLELNLLKDQSRNSRKRLTDWRMNLLVNRRNTKLLQRNWKQPLLSALVTKFIFLFYCKKLLKPHKTCLYKYLIISEK